MRTILMTVFAVLFTISTASAAEKPRSPYSGTIGYELCQDKERFDCFIVVERVIEGKIISGNKERVVKKTVIDTWELLFPNAASRELVMKLNRLNVVLKKGMPLAIPKELAGKTLADFSPFPRWIKAPDEKVLIFDPALLAWAAYKPNGELIRWGPAIGGMDRCLDTWKRCRTVVGEFKVTIMGDAESRSHIYPIGCGSKKNPCAPMPWFIGFFKRLYGFHGSEKMVGKHASHGCVRLFLDDAKWLNQNFAEIGTKVIIRKYPYPPKG